MPGYQFGDNAIACDRLRLLADVFHDSTTVFLRRVVSSSPKLALDLGSGAGHSTALLREITGATRVIGLDGSPGFVAAAQSRYGNVAEFLQHDVTKTPFPTPSADLIYGRFLLSHLQSPKETLASWAAQLCHRGLLLLEELEFIATESPGFNAYERFVEALLAAQGQTLFVGSEIASCRPDGTDLVSSDVARVPVLRNDAATLALMNLSQLRKTEWAQEHHAASWFDDLARELELFRDSDGESVVFGMRQLAVRTHQ